MFFFARDDQTPFSVIQWIAAWGLPHVSLTLDLPFTGKTNASARNSRVHAYLGSFAQEMERASPGPLTTTKAIPQAIFAQPRI